MFDDITIIEKSFALLVSKVRYDEIEEDQQFVLGIMNSLR